MNLKNIEGNLLAYKKLEPGTFQHIDQIITEHIDRIITQLKTDYIITDPSFVGGKTLYTADGQLYTVQGKKNLWAITREPQNLVLQSQNIDEAYRQLKIEGNYFPNETEARLSLDHPDTVVVDIEGLNLEGLERYRGRDEDYSGPKGEKYGGFNVDPSNLKLLNSQQRLVAQRIYGPDEDKFMRNMKMFEKFAVRAYIEVLAPDYINQVLDENDRKIFGRSSQLNDLDKSFDKSYFPNCCNFNTKEWDGENVSEDGILRGVLRVKAQNNKVSSAPKRIQGVVAPTMEEILAMSQNHIPKYGLKQFEADLRKLYQQ